MCHHRLIEIYLLIFPLQISFECFFRNTTCLSEKKRVKHPIRRKRYFKPHTHTQKKNPATGSRIRNLMLHKIISCNDRDQIQFPHVCRQYFKQPQDERLKPSVQPSDLIKRDKGPCNYHHTKEVRI